MTSSSSQLVFYRGESNLLTVDEVFLNGCDLKDLLNSYERIHSQNSNIVTYQHSVIEYKTEIQERSRGKYYSVDHPKDVLKCYIINKEKGIIIRVIDQQIFQKLRQIEKLIRRYKHEYNQMKIKEEKLIKKHGDLFIVGAEDKETYIRKPSYQVLRNYKKLVGDFWVDFTKPLSKMSREELISLYQMDHLNKDHFLKYYKTALTEKEMEKMEDIRENMWKIMDVEDIDHFGKIQSVEEVKDDDLLKIPLIEDSNFLPDNSKKVYKAKPMPSVSRKINEEKDLHKEFLNYKEKIKVEGTPEFLYHKNMEKEEIINVANLIDKKKMAKFRWYIAIKTIITRNKCNYVFKCFSNYIGILVIKIKNEFDLLSKPIKSLIENIKKNLDHEYTQKENKYLYELAEIKTKISVLTENLRLNSGVNPIDDLVKIGKEISKIKETLVGLKLKNKDIENSLARKQKIIEKKNKEILELKEFSRKLKVSNPAEYCNSKITEDLFWFKIRFESKWFGWSINKSFRRLLSAVFVPNCVLKLMTIDDIPSLNSKEKRDLCVFMCRLCIITGSSHAAKLIHLMENPENIYYTGMNCYDNTFGKVFNDDDYEAIGAAISFVSRITKAKYIWKKHMDKFDVIKSDKSLCRKYYELNPIENLINEEHYSDEHDKIKEELDEKYFDQIMINPINVFDKNDDIEDFEEIKSSKNEDEMDDILMDMLMC